MSIAAVEVRKKWCVFDTASGDGGTQRLFTVPVGAPLGVADRVVCLERVYVGALAENFASWKATMGELTIGVHHYRGSLDIRRASRSPPKGIFDKLGAPQDWEFHRFDFPEAVTLSPRQLVHFEVIPAPYKGKLPRGNLRVALTGYVIPDAVADAP